MSQADFDKHVTINQTRILSLENSGFLFDVNAEIKSDWAIAGYQDQFFINISPNNNNYKGTLQKNKMLTKSEILQYLYETNDKFNFVKINNNSLFYQSADEVLKRLAKKAKVDKFCNYGISIDKLTGNMSLSVFLFIVEGNDPICIQGSADLLTGKLETSESHGCVID